MKSKPGECLWRYLPISAPQIFQSQKETAMDLATLTALAMTGLTAFLAGAVDGAAHKAGEAVYDQGKRLYDLIRARFGKEPDGGKASQALTILADDPDNRGPVETKLYRVLQADPDFAQALRAIIQSGPRQTITAEEEAIARRIRQSNSARVGEQTVEIKKGATGTDFIQEIN